MDFVLDRCWSPSHLLMWTFPYPHPLSFHTPCSKLLPLHSCFTVFLCIDMATIAFIQFCYFFMYMCLSVVSKWTINIHFINYCISHQPQWCQGLNQTLHGDKELRSYWRRNIKSIKRHTKGSEDSNFGYHGKSNITLPQRVKGLLEKKIMWL